MRAITITAIVAVKAEPITLLKPIGHQITCSVSSRKRLTVSPGDAGTARPPGSWRMRRKTLRCNIAAFAYANAPFVDCSVKAVMNIASSRMLSSANGDSNQLSESVDAPFAKRSNTILAASPGRMFEPQPRRTPARLISWRRGRKRCNRHA